MSQPRFTWVGLHGIAHMYQSRRQKQFCHCGRFHKICSLPLVPWIFPSPPPSSQTGCRDRRRNDNGFDEPKRANVLKKRGNVDTECIGCEFRPRCMNWCCCINYALTGAIDETDGIVCFHERTAIKVADRVGSLLFEEKNPAFLNRFYYEEV